MDTLKYKRLTINIVTNWYLSRNIPILIISRCLNNMLIQCIPFIDYHRDERNNKKVFRKFYKVLGKSPHQHSS